jgi:hypothetical protein
MSTATLVRSEMRLLHRSGAWVVVAGACLWLVAALIQEPGFARGAGLRFFWPCADAAGQLLVLFLPFLWLVARPASGSWLRTSSSPARDASITALSTICYGSIALAVYCSSAWCLDARAADSSSRAFRMLMRGHLLLLPIATITPALLWSLMSPMHRFAVYLLLLVSSFLLGIPVPVGTLDAIPMASSEPLTWRHADSLILAATGVGGMLVSIGTAQRRS